MKMTNLEYKGRYFSQRSTDGYINATEMCQSHGKLVADWLRTKDYDRYTKALSSVMGIPITELVTVFQGGSPCEQGTWIHPRLAIKLARWISVEFELWCDDHIKVLVEMGSTQLSNIPLPHRSKVVKSSERAEISPHLIRAWVVLCESSCWLTNKEIARQAGVVPRTARYYTKYLFGLGLLDMLEVFPGHKFRISPVANKRNPAAYQRLEEIKEVYATQFTLD